MARDKDDLRAAIAAAMAKGKTKRPRPASRTKSKGSYRDQLADANRFGGKRPERKVVKTLMSYPPIKVYNDGSRERVQPKPSSGRRKPSTMPRRPRLDSTKYRQPKPARKKDK